MYCCPICKKPVSSEIRGLIWHLRNVHSLSDGQDYTIFCSQNGCQRSYHNINSYSKHLAREHSSEDSLLCMATQLSKSDGSDNVLDKNISNNTHLTTDMTSAGEENTSMCYSKSDDAVSVTSHAATFAAKMYSCSNITLSDVQRSVTCTKELLDRTIDSLQASTSALFKSLAVPDDNKRFCSLMKEFEAAKECLDNIDNPYKMTNFFETEYSLVKPTEIFLGHRADTIKKNGIAQQTLAADTFQYISILETLKFIFGNKTFQTLYLQSHRSTDGKMYDYCDGDHFANHKLYKTHPNGLQIQIYFDDLETVNPLGSKTKIHKMGAVYFSLRNLSPEYNSSLANIHLCLLFNSIDREKYGFAKIFEPLLDDIKVLEMQGIDILIRGETHTVYGTVCLFTADNLACHALCGYAESFSANKFCHICLVDKSTSQTTFNEDDIEKRNRHNYLQHVVINDVSITGIKGDSCLNTLEFFHVTENVGVDIMHDVLEGVAPLEVRLLLQRYIYEEKLLCLEQLNERIASYDYRYSNTKNKPSVILNLKSETAIKQTASQMWCLIQNLPFLLGDIVNPESLHWQLFILLREICSIIFAPVVTRGLAVFLKQLIIDHHKLFKELYPARNLIPKHHFMIHYPSMLIKFGPLSKLWCMRFEAKHNPLKRQAHAVCNFKNISKTLAYKNQVQQMHCWKFGDPLVHTMCVPNTYPVVVCSLEYGNQIREKLSSLSDVSTDTVHVSNSVSFCGYTYRTGSILMSASSEDEPIFGEVVHLFPKVDQNMLLAFLRTVKVKYFDDHFYSFVVEKMEEYRLVQIPTDLSDSRPLDIQTSFLDDQIYINPRYKVLT